MNNQELILDLCGLAGVIFHCLLKLNSLLNDARVANINFRWRKDYLQRDIVPIMLSMLSVLIWHLVFAEVAASYPKISAFARVSFVGMGMIGSYIIQTLMSKAKKKIRQVIDEKTGIEDKTDLPK